MEGIGKKIRELTSVKFRFTSLTGNGMQRLQKLGCTECDLHIFNDGGTSWTCDEMNEDFSFVQIDDEEEIPEKMELYNALIEGQEKVREYSEIMKDKPESVERQKKFHEENMGKFYKELYGHSYNDRFSRLNSPIFHTRNKGICPVCGADLTI